MKVVHLRPSTTGKRSFTSAEALIEEVRNQLFGTGENYKVIAERTNVSRSTINNLAIGKTRWPRPTTLCPLLDTLGLEMRMVKKGSAES
jgi:transcriptional regulator with XRE-family HTH domain